MTPSQRRKKLSTLKKNNRKEARPKPFWLFGLVLIVAVIILSFITGRFKSQSKIALVINGKNGEITVQNFDFEQKEIVTVIIPAETQLDVSNQFGYYRARSIWKLGENEKKEGELLKGSVIKNFDFPIIAWADSKATGLGTGRVGDLLGAVLTPYKSNLCWGDKIRLGIFSLGIKPEDRREILLKDTNYLDKVKLIDGEMGYVIQDSTPPLSLAGVFSEETGKQMPFRALIVDSTQKFGLVERASGVLEVMGIKVTSIRKGDPNGEVCVVGGKDEKLVKKISFIYSCKIDKNYYDDNFDLTLTFGEEFAKRY